MTLKINIEIYLCLVNFKHESACFYIPKMILHNLSLFNMYRTVHFWTTLEGQKKRLDHFSLAINVCMDKSTQKYNYANMKDQTGSTNSIEIVQGNLLGSLCSIHWIS